jgi:hypothetical protein
MTKIHGNHGQKHQSRIENIHEDFMADEVPIVPLRIFNQAKD